MLNNYETVFILSPVLSADQTKEAVTKFTTLVTDNGGQVVNLEEWGAKKLAYSIQKYSTGYYVFIEFEAESSFVDVLETQFRRDERVIRFLTFRQDKFALEYAQKRRRNRGIKSEEVAIASDSIENEKVESTNE